MVISIVLLVVALSIGVWVLGESLNRDAVAPAILLFIALFAIYLGLQAMLEHVPALRRNTKLKTILQDEVLGFGYTLGVPISLRHLLVVEGTIHVFRELIVVLILMVVIMTTTMLVAGVWPRSKGFWNF